MDGVVDVVEFFEVLGGAWPFRIARLAVVRAFTAQYGMSDADAGRFRLLRRDQVLRHDRYWLRPTLMPRGCSAAAHSMDRNAEQPSRKYHTHRRIDHVARGVRVLSPWPHGFDCHGLTVRATSNPAVIIVLDPRPANKTGVVVLARP